MKKIIPGSTIVGASGKKLIVGRVEGDTIYSGNLKIQYAGVLEVWEISKIETDSYACLKSNGRVTSWIQFEYLQLLECL